MEKSYICETDIKWKKKDILIKRIFYDVKNLFPKSKLQYTYINIFLLSLFFTFIHKYLEQTLPSLYKSIENDFNTDVKTLYYMNTIYKLAYSASNFFFAIYFDYSFKKIFCSKYDQVKSNDTQCEEIVKGEDELTENVKLMDEINLQTDEKYAELNESNKEEILYNDVKYVKNTFNKNDEVTIREYTYILNILIISSLIYIIVIIGIMLSSNFYYFFFFMFAMGINNSSIYILIQKIYTNNVYSENRSTIFGFLHFFSSISHMLSISINTNLSNKFYYGFKGWRICYFIISFFPLIVCIFLFKLIKHKKLGTDKSKHASMNYFVSFDGLTKVSNENSEDNYSKNCNKSHFNELSKKEVQPYDIEQKFLKSDIFKENYEDTFEMKNSYFDSNDLNETKQILSFNENNSYINNKSSMNNSTYISNDCNDNSINFNMDKIDSNIIKRNFINSNEDSLKQYYNKNNLYNNNINNSGDSFSLDLSSNIVSKDKKNEHNVNEKGDTISFFTNENEEKDKLEQKGEMDKLLENEENKKKKKLKYEFSYIYEVKYVFKNYSFWLMITMGMLNGIPKHVLSLMIYFFQYCNISDFKSGFIISVSWLCASLISPFIGIISDYIYKLNKDINRQLIGMCTHFLRIGLMFILFFFIPKEAESFIYFVIISLFMGILSGWINIGTHKPIIIDIVKQRHTAFVMALMNAFENIGSSIIGTFFLSFLLNRYNYIDRKKVNNFSDINVNKHNVNVLSDVLLILTCLPWLLSFCLLYILKFTYKKDKLYNNII
ncbi:metabolite/drug transporter, putative [Plasmodium gallinaceum]|uniref:Metabolite/drug transporter, putative n=1 Tax=Plasmodium gallinaceum TaxID=5849 RepID=A0A1J1GU16_PLAGA|nr:metabolite/drug transporter, putative [Plasmodium gallinaceum]CRG95785.1 metabolite/drug transporter, putative [Plasmodium gallinaceum]